MDRSRFTKTDSSPTKTTPTLIGRQLSNLAKKPVPKINIPKEPPITRPIEKPKKPLPSSSTTGFGSWKPPERQRTVSNSVSHTEYFGSSNTLGKGNKLADPLRTEFKRRPSQVTAPQNQRLEVLNIHSNEYYMSNKYRGKAVIFLHTKFESEDLPYRVGGERDVELLKAQLPRLGFQSSDVKVHRELTMKQVLGKLFEIANEDHSNNDCLMVFFLTHGENNDLIHAADTEYPISKIWRNFFGDSSPTLVGKPKLFFIVACRGSDTDDGIRISERRGTANQTQMDSTPRQPRQFYSIPSDADVLTVYSTTPGHYSYREDSRGTWYIEALCQEIKKLSPSEEINFTDFLARVNRHLSISYETYDDENDKFHRKKQCSSYTSTLTRCIKITAS